MAHKFKDSNGKTVYMCDRPFVAIMPKSLEIGDEIVLKGKIKDDAKLFSVNFTLDCGKNIAYHFETNFIDDTVRQDFNIDGRWYLSANSVPNTWIDGPGQGFILTFHFDDSEILVYSDDEFRNIQYRFEYQLDLGDITAIQVWDDVDYISELIFRYRKNK